MRTVTLGSLGAMAPIVPAGAPQYYGLGEASITDTLTSKTYWMGVGAGALVGGIFGWWLAQK